MRTTTRQLVRHAILNAAHSPRRVQDGHGVAIGNADGSPGEVFGTRAPGHPQSRQKRG